MSSKKDDIQEEYVFEYYDEDFGEFEDGEPPKFVEEYNEVNFEEDLDDDQLRIINNLKGPMLVIAGAGSGKTRVIVYSVAKLLVSGVRPSEIMLVTFTNKASKEMINRVEILLGKRPKGIWAGTFHSIANRFIRRYAKTLGLKTNYTIMDVPDSRALMKLAIDDSNIKELTERFPTAKMAKDILSYSINCNKTIKEVIDWKYNQFSNEEILDKLKEVFKRYEAKKVKNSLVDFDDLLVYWSRLLDEKSVAQRIAKNIKYVLVDEYQDTNYIQDDIVSKIVSQNPERNVIAVGDDAQSIYAFRGANFKNIIDFKDHYEGCKVYKITYNYRSIPEILALANESLKHNQFQFKKDMKKTRKNGVKPFQVNVGDDEDQARFISNEILKLREEGFELKEMAVLYRATSHSLKVEVELRKKNIPYIVRAGVSFFEKAHIKDLLVHLRVLENPYDEVSWSRIFLIIPGLGQTSGSKIFETISKTEDPIHTLLDPYFFKSQMKGARITVKAQKNLISHIKYLKNYSQDDNPSEIIIDLIKLITDYLKSKYPAWQERVDDLKQLAIYAQTFPTIRLFLETLNLNLSSIESKSVQMGSQKDDEEPLILSTIHRAKGLEWRVVFIPMLCEDSFPSGRVVGDVESFEEERRVFYVAITRAKDRLYLITPAIVERFGGYRTVRASQFISELAPRVYTRSSVKFKPPEKKSTPKDKPYKPIFTTADNIISEKTKSKPKSQKFKIKQKELLK